MTEMGLRTLWALHEKSMERFRVWTCRQRPPRSRRNLLDLKLSIADKILEDCHFCESGAISIEKKGGLAPAVSATDPGISKRVLHMGEEPELGACRTRYSSQDVPFKWHLFAQNWDISQNHRPRKVRPKGSCCHHRPSLRAERGTGCVAIRHRHPVHPSRCSGQLDLDIHQVWNSTPCTCHPRPCPC